MISIAFIVILVALDVLSKFVVTGFVKPGTNQDLVTGVISVTHEKGNYNVFNFFEMRTFIVCVTAIIIIVALVFTENKFSPTRNKKHKLVFNLYIAGAVAVLVDRLLYNYAIQTLELETFFFSTLLDFAMSYLIAATALIGYIVLRRKTISVVEQEV